MLPSTFRYERLLVSDYLKGLLYSVAAEAWSFRLFQVDRQLFESGRNSGNSYRYCQSERILYLIYKSYMCVRPSVRLWRQKQDEVLKRARSSKPSRTWTEVSVCPSRQTAQGRGRAGQDRAGAGAGQDRTGQGRAGQPRIFILFFSYWPRRPFFSFSYCPSQLRGWMKCPSGLMTGRI